MASSTESFAKKVQSIKIHDCIKLTIDTEILSANFDLIKQCLTRISDIEGKFQQSVKNKNHNENQISKRIASLQQSLNENAKQISKNSQEINLLKQNLGEDLKKKFDELQSLSKNNQNIEDLAKKLESLDIFVSNNFFKDYKMKTQQQLRDAMKTKQKLSQFVDQEQFKQHVSTTNTEFSNSRILLHQINTNQKLITQNVQNIKIDVKEAKNQVEQNSKMIKQINFVEMKQKMRKLKEETDNKIGDMLLKLKKKIGTGELLDLEKVLIDKIDKYLLGINNDSASKSETKQALQFLEKRINQISQLIAPKDQNDQQALFARKKWNCASCAKDLGKFEGKLGQFRPWAVFPARQMNPQMTGGYGYLNYIEKISQKRGTSVDDSGIQRLSKTFYNQQTSQQRQISPGKKLSLSKTTNFMSSYGVKTQRGMSSLKQQYFKSDKERGNSSKMFRVKKDKLKDNSYVEVNQKVKVKDV